MNLHQLFEKRVSQRQRDEVSRLVSELSGVEARFRRSFVRTFDQIAERIDVNQLARLLREGRAFEATEIINAQALAAGVRPVATQASDAVLSAGRRAVAQVPSELNVSFGVTNPRVVEFMRRNELRLVRELTAHARSSIRETITDGIAAGRNPLVVARDVRENLKLTRGGTRRVVAYRARLEAERARAIEQGKKARSEKQIDRMVQGYQRKALRVRSETIARTEATRATNYGNREGWRQAIEDGNIEPDEVRRFWIYTKDNKTRHSHREIPKMNEDGVGIDEPFRSPLGNIMFPGDPDADPANTINCRCTVFMKYVPRRFQ